jgi:hypothetical protein
MSRLDVGRLSIAAALVGRYGNLPYIMIRLQVSVTGIFQGREAWRTS